MKPIERIVLFHWNAAETVERLARLRQAGYAAEAGGEINPARLRALGQPPPAAFVIDLARLPSHGREVGVALRAQKTTRHAALVFVGGDPVKVDRVRQVLPDAVFTTWEDIGPALAQALEAQPQEVVVPKSIMDAYAGQALVRKLGIKAGMAVRLRAAPTDIAVTLGELPPGARLLAAEDTASAAQPADLGLFFARTQFDLLSEIETALAWPGLRSLWIAWPKKAAAAAAQPDALTQPFVRRCGLERGWVDYKVCSIDATWSGLLFTRRKA